MLRYLRLLKLNVKALSCLILINILSVGITLFEYHIFIFRF